MKYYKIIRNGTVIGAGTLFLKWYNRVRRYCYCGEDEAECVKNVITGRLYHPDWLLTPPADAYAVDNAEVEMIGAEEFEEIVKDLGGDNEET